MGKTINKRVIVDSSKTIIYTAHFTAIEKELEYAWVKNRLKQHKKSVLEDDPNLPQEMKPRTEAILEKFEAKLKALRYTG